MELTRVQYERITPLLPKQRGSVSLSNLQVLNAILYVAEHGGKWPRPAGAVRQRAHHLHAQEPAVEERGPGPRVRAPAAGADDPHPDRDPASRQHPHQGTPRRHGALKKRPVVHRQIPGRMEHPASSGGRE